MKTTARRLKGCEMDKRASIRDVANAAAVSVATVSNVLNRPHAVARDTRQRVLNAIEALDFQRNEQAASLRLRRPATRQRKAEHPPAVPPNTSTATTDTDPDHAPEKTDSDKSDWHLIPAAQPVSIEQQGRKLGTGLADGSMPDGSGIWVRFDDGRGRLLLTRDDGYAVTSAEVAR